MTGWATQEIRERAIALLALRGWSPGGLGEQGPISADWAVALASGEAHKGAPEEGGPYLTTISELEATLESGSLVDWEMEWGRTAEQVIGLLRFGYGRTHGVAGPTAGSEPLSREEEEQMGEHFRATVVHRRELRATLSRLLRLYAAARARVRREVVARA